MPLSFPTQPDICLLVRDGLFAFDLTVTGDFFLLQLRDNVHEEYDQGYFEAIE